MVKEAEKDYICPVTFLTVQTTASKGYTTEVNGLCFLANSLVTEFGKINITFPYLEKLL